MFTKSIKFRGALIFWLAILLLIFSCEKEKEIPLSEQVAKRESAGTEEVEKKAGEELIPAKRRAELREDLEALMADLEAKEKELKIKGEELNRKDADLQAREAELVQKEEGVKRLQVVSYVILIMGIVMIIAAFIIAVKGKLITIKPLEKIKAIRKKEEKVEAAPKKPSPEGKKDQKKREK